MVVVVAPKDPEEEYLNQGPGEGLTLDPDGIGQGHPGEADMTVDLVQADSQAEAGTQIFLQQQEQQLQQQQQQEGQQQQG